MSAAVMPPSNPSVEQGHSVLPLTTNLTASSLTSGGNSCLDEQIERLKRCEYLREGEVKALCLRAREILVDESNVQRVDAPVTVSSFICVRPHSCWRNNTFHQLMHSFLFIILRYVVIFTGSSTTWSSCSKSEVNVLIRIISF
jgi:hypothetical protein